MGFSRQKSTAGWRLGLGVAASQAVAPTSQLQLANWPALAHGSAVRRTVHQSVGISASASLAVFRSTASTKSPIAGLNRRCIFRKDKRVQNPGDVRASGLGFGESGHVFSKHKKARECGH